MLVTERCGLWLQVFYSRFFQRLTNPHATGKLKGHGLKPSGLSLSYLALGVCLVIWNLELVRLFVTKMPPPTSLRVAWIRFGHG